MLETRSIQLLSFRVAAIIKTIVKLLRIDEFDFQTNPQFINTILLQKLALPHLRKFLTRKPPLFSRLHESKNWVVSYLETPFPQRKPAKIKENSIQRCLSKKRKKKKTKKWTKQRERKIEDAETGSKRISASRKRTRVR